jgi:hypothetical protein
VLTPTSKQEGMKEGADPHQQTRFDFVDSRLQPARPPSIPSLSGADPHQQNKRERRGQAYHVTSRPNPRRSRRVRFLAMKGLKEARREGIESGAAIAELGFPERRVPNEGVEGGRASCGGRVTVQRCSRGKGLKEASSQEGRDSCQKGLKGLKEAEPAAECTGPGESTAGRRARLSLSPPTIPSGCLCLHLVAAFPSSRVSTSSTRARLSEELNPSLHYETVCPSGLQHGGVEGGRGMSCLGRSSRRRGAASSSSRFQHRPVYRDELPRQVVSSS